MNEYPRLSAIFVIALEIGSVCVCLASIGNGEL